MTTLIVFATQDYQDCREFGIDYEAVENEIRRRMPATEVIAGDEELCFEYSEEGEVVARGFPFRYTLWRIQYPLR